MGGVDTLRGYPQFSLVPQDIADAVLESDGALTIDDVILRGGDLFINPRAELRIPLTKSLRTALFLDTGNLWSAGANFNPLVLRYTAGTGLRIETPVGPLVFDYGFNLERLLDVLGRPNAHPRYWESLGAFHFSIGLF
jgi:outer membrane protein assembly factor BamA